MKVTSYPSLQGEERDITNSVRIPTAVSIGTNML